MISFIVTCSDIRVEDVQATVGSITALWPAADEREIIIVDHGTGKPIIGDLKDISDTLLYIRTHAKDTATARNTGLNAATGTFIQLIDGGDTLALTAYNHCLDIVKYDNPDMVTLGITTPGSRRRGSLYKFFDAETGADYMRNKRPRSDIRAFIFRKSLLGGVQLGNPLTADDDCSFITTLLTRARQIVRTEAYAYLRRQT